MMPPMPPARAYYEQLTFYGWLARGVFFEQ
jgi:hypothetical protein